MATDTRKISVGDKLKFLGEKQRYKVQAVSGDGRWAVCTKPFNLQRTVVYTVVDFVDGVRGVDNYGGLGYETAEHCERACAMFESGDAEHSRRHPPIPLRINYPLSVLAVPSPEETTDGQ
jgi:hypothetical protein